MTRPIIHIGFHKTATSWFQRHVYPHVRSHRYVDRVLVRRTMLFGSAFSFDAAAARATLGFDEPGPPPLLCDEDLAGTMHLGIASGFIAKEVAHRLHALAPDARIVIFVRAQAPTIAATYVQYLREGGTGNVRTYLFPDEYRHPGKVRPFKLRGFAFEPLRYHELIAHYDALFGRENVHVYLYEDLSCDQPALLARLAADTGIDLPASLPSGKAINASYRVGVMPIARVLNLFTRRAVGPKNIIFHVPYWYPVRKRLLEALGKLAIFGPKPKASRLFDTHLQRWIEQSYWADNQRLATRVDRELGPLGYATAAPAMPIERPTRSRLLRWMRN